MALKDCFVEFEFHDRERFKKLAAICLALRAAKLKEDFSDQKYWLEFFDGDALKHFWWPTEEEAKAYFDRWFSTPIPQRWNDPSLKKDWTFDSMIAAFENVEYVLGDCKLLDSNRGRITFEVWSYPYGGVGCIHALVESFGFRVISEDV